MMFSVGTSARSAARRRGCAKSIDGAARAPGQSAASQDPRQECRAKQAKKSDAACRVERTELSLAARDDGCNLYSPVVSVIGAVATNTRASGGSVIGFTRERLRKKTPFSEGLRTNRARQE